MANIPSGQSRLACWLANDLNLPGSAIDAAGHTVFGFNNANGASQSWKAGRSLNSLPNNRMNRLGVYRIQAGSAPLTLPNTVAGLGGAIDLSSVLSGNPSPTPTPPGGTPTPTPGDIDWGIMPVGAPSGYVARSAVPNGAVRKEYWFGNSVSDARFDTNSNGGVDAFATQAGYDFTYARSMIPGSPLDFLLENYQNALTTPPYGNYVNAFTNYTWDWVTFQPFDRGIEQDLPAIQQVIDVALPLSGSGLQPWIYERWMRKRDVGENDATYWNSAWSEPYTANYRYEMQDYFIQLLNAVRQNETRVKPALLVPVGSVMGRFNRKAQAGLIPGYQSAFDLYSDPIHLDNVGSFLVAATHYSAFFFRDPTGLSVPSGFGTINQTLANTIYSTIWETVSNHRFCAYIPAS